MKYKKKLYSVLLLNYLKNQKIKIFFLAIVLLCEIAVQIINPLIVKDFIDTALINNKLLLKKIAIIYILLAFGQQFFSIITTYLGQIIGWSATNSLREDLVKHCLTLDMKFYKDKRPGELIERIDGDVSMLFNFFSKMGILLVSNSLLVIGVLFMYFRVDYRIGIAQVTFVIIAFYALLKFKELGKKYWKENRQVSTRIFGYVGECINNTEDVNANGAKNYVMFRFYEQLKQWLPIRIKSSIAGWGMFMVSLALQAVGFAISFIIGTYLWKQSMISVGTIYLFYNYTNYLIKPIDSIQKQLQNMQGASASISRIEEILLMESNIKDNKSDIRIDDKFSLLINNLHFGYEDNTEVLKDISLKLDNNKTLALIGRTGSGKTTLARLLVRLYDVNSGYIKFGDYNIKDIPIKELRRRIAYVTQEVQLFNGTVRNNLTFYDRSINDESIYEAIKEIGLEKWFTKFDKGLDTVLGVKGIGLSAGEAQLLTLVRVFLKNPYMVILDEVSSKLDPETERQLQNTIVKLLKGRVGIIIAHRIWTIKFVDEVMILENGRVLEYGYRKALEEDKNSRLNTLLRTGLQEELA